MAVDIRQFEYFRTIVKDEPGEGFNVLSALASQGVNLLAFTAIPVGANETELTLYPDNSHALTHASSAAGMRLDGPHPALFVQGDDELGAIANLHRKLAAAGLNVASATGLTDGRGSFGYIIHMHPADVGRAEAVLREEVSSLA
jgi:hypothetical protein